MFSKCPFTPAQKQFLSQSQYYNPFGISPPGFTDSFCMTIMAGTMPWDIQSGETVTYENITSYYGLDPTVFQPLVIKTWARRIHLWLATSKLPVTPEMSLLKPFADLYDPQ
jgi:hypothetical protein